MYRTPETETVFGFDEMSSAFPKVPKTYKPKNVLHPAWSMSRERRIAPRYKQRYRQSPWYNRHLLVRYVVRSCSLRNLPSQRSDWSTCL